MAHRKRPTTVVIVTGEQVSIDAVVDSIVGHNSPARNDPPREPRPPKLKVVRGKPAA